MTGFYDCCECSECSYERMIIFFEKLKRNNDTGLQADLLPRRYIMQALVQRAHLMNERWTGSLKIVTQSTRYIHRVLENCTVGRRRLDRPTDRQTDM